MAGNADAVRRSFELVDPGKSGTIRADDLKAVLGELNPAFEANGLNAFCNWAAATYGKDGHINYNDLISSLCSNDGASGYAGYLVPLVAQSKLASELQDVRQELDAMKILARRQPFVFTVGQYNLLAGYMGNNMEPWFLYGVDMPASRRSEVMKMHGARGPDGRPANAGWPNYVKGILSDEEQKTVERVHAEHFAWDRRKDRLLDVIDQMDSDIISLVECDYFEDHFEPALIAKGYKTVWQKRPRPASKDGCCIAYRAGLFDLVASTAVEYVDKYDPVTQKSHKDRIALLGLLRVKTTGQVICFVSTHLQRNPEDPKQDYLRARQVGQVIRMLAQFTFDHDAFQAPVIFVGDLNCTSFERLRGLANVVSILNKETLLHPFSFDCKDVPTGPTSVTSARCMRIDAIMYQSHLLELLDVQEIPELSMDCPIPNAEHPSDHVPVVATFRARSRLCMTNQLGKEWYFAVAGQPGSVPLDASQLKAAFKLYDFDGTGHSSLDEMHKVFGNIFGIAPPCAEEVIAKLPPTGIDFATFVSEYHKAVAGAGIPGLEDFKAAFLAVDTNSDGTVDLDEFLAVFANCAPAAVSQEVLKDLFNLIDTSGDGKISLDEMLKYLSKSWVARFDPSTPG